MDFHRCSPVHEPVTAVVDLPGSKSITNRALVVAALADGTSLLSGVLLADDTRLMLRALAALGVSATLDKQEHRVEVTGCRGFIPEGRAELECGNAGTVIRFLTALTTLGHGQYALGGTQRMCERPIGSLVDALRALGAGVEYADREGYPPLMIHAQALRGGRVALDSPESSQFASAVLMAAPYARTDVMLDVRGGVTSAPYLKMTTAVMEAFGVPAVTKYTDHGARFVVEAPQRYQARAYDIEPDASNATYFLAAPAIAGGKVTVRRLGTDSIQGDARFVEVLARMGCRVTRSALELTVAGPDPTNGLVGLDIDLNDMPDTVQTLAVVALFAKGPTRIRNVANLRVKETDRLAALTSELTKLGASVDEAADGLTIHPPGRVAAAAPIETYDDHRMAMSFAVAGLRCPGLTIRNPNCCAKTFPTFFQHWGRAFPPVRHG